MVGKIPLDWRSTVSKLLSRFRVGYQIGFIGAIGVLGLLIVGVFYFTGLSVETRAQREWPAPTRR